MKRVPMMCIPVDNFQGDEFVDLLEEVDMEPLKNLVLVQVKSGDDCTFLVPKYVDYSLLKTIMDCNLN